MAQQIVEPISSYTIHSSTAHEAAKERTRIKDVWRLLELAKVEVAMLKGLDKVDQGLPQIDSIVSNMGTSRKSKGGRGGGGGGGGGTH
jgi:hypothetical protein